jgi:hypothetical protein
VVAPAGGSLAGVTGNLALLAASEPPGDGLRTLANSAAGPVAVDPTGCNNLNIPGGTLASGSYFVLYTIVYPSGVGHPYGEREGRYDVTLLRGRRGPRVTTLQFG